MNGIKLKKLLLFVQGREDVKMFPGGNVSVVRFACR